MTVPPYCSSFSAISIFGADLGALLWTIFMIPGSSSSSPLPNTTSAFTTLAASPGLGSYECGSPLRGTTEVTSTRSPPTCSTRSATIAVVVDTVSVASDDPARGPLHPAAAVASSAQAAVSTVVVRRAWPRMGIPSFSDAPWSQRARRIAAYGGPGGWPGPDPPHAELSSGGMPTAYGEHRPAAREQRGHRGAA